jgi:hypothetical protein
MPTNLAEQRVDDEHQRVGGTCAGTYGEIQVPEQIATYDQTID